MHIFCLNTWIFLDFGDGLYFMLSSINFCANQIIFMVRKRSSVDFKFVICPGILNKLIILYTCYRCTSCTDVQSTSLDEVTIICPLTAFASARDR